MRNIKAIEIRNLISKLCIDANLRLRDDVLKAIRNAIRREKDNVSKRALELLIENARVASEDKIALCQDTGLAIVFMEIGQDVHIAGGSLKDAVNKGVEDGYKRGYLRKSVVISPLTRKNTGTNTPAILHASIVPGDSIKVWVMAKGFGSENKSKIAMLNPTDDEKKIIDFIVKTVEHAGPEACPPFILGIGIGGTFDEAAFLSKKALLRRIDKKNPDPLLSRLEKEILDEINELRIGPMGFGGKTTALGVNILSSATHIAGLPVAVNVSCHATRTAYGVI